MFRPPLHMLTLQQRNANTQYIIVNNNWHTLHASDQHAKALLENARIRKGVDFQFTWGTLNVAINIGRVKINNQLLYPCNGMQRNTFPGVVKVVHKELHKIYQFHSINLTIYWKPFIQHPIKFFKLTFAKDPKLSGKFCSGEFANDNWKVKKK